MTLTHRNTSRDSWALPLPGAESGVQDLPALLATCTPHLTFKELVLHGNRIRCYFKNLFSYVLWVYVLNAKLNHPGSPGIWRTFLTVHREPFNLLWAFSTTKGLDRLLLSGTWWRGIPMKSPPGKSELMTKVKNRHRLLKVGSGTIGASGQTEMRVRKEI